MHKGEDLDCKVISVMIRHFNIFKYFLLEYNLFGPELFRYSWDFIDNDNCFPKVKRFLRYSSDYAIQHPGQYK